MFPVDRSRGFPLRERIAKHPDVYIFDDSFSALDYKTDAVLRSALKEKTTDSVSSDCGPKNQYNSSCRADHCFG